MRLSEGALESARAIISARLGLDFQGSLAALLERGLHDILRAAAVPAQEAEAYLERLWSLPYGEPQWMRLAAYFTVGETYFFRDTACFDALEKEVLPELIASRRRRASPSLRIWSAGCATGEEPYSLAILLNRLLAGARDLSVEILATDVNVSALDAARRGIYREWSLRSVPSWIRSQYFDRLGSGVYELDPAIRRMVTFMPHNLAEELDPRGLMGAMDVVLCRNVLMYFTPERARRTAMRLQGALAADGWLVTSAAEASAALFRPMTPVNFTGAILFCKHPVSHPVVSLRCPVSTPLPEARSAYSGHDADPRPVPHMKTRTESCPRPPTLLARARSLANEGRLAEARRECEAALSSDVLDAEAHMLLATISHEQGDTRAALDALRRTLYLDPDCALAHYLLGSLLLRQGEQARGRRYMENAEMLLSAASPSDVVAGTDGLPAHHLRGATRAYLDADGGQSR